MGEKQQIGIARGTNILCAKSQKFWRSIRSMHARLHAANKTAKEETMGARSLPAAAGNGMHAGDPPYSHADDDDDADSDAVTTKPDSDGDPTRESHFRIHTSASSSCARFLSGSEASRADDSAAMPMPLPRSKEECMDKVQHEAS
jgi:hypothetical protein